MAAAQSDLWPQNISFSTVYCVHPFLYSPAHSQCQSNGNMAIVSYRIIVLAQDLDATNDGGLEEGGIS